MGGVKEESQCARKGMNDGAGLLFYGLGVTYGILVVPALARELAVTTSSFRTGRNLFVVQVASFP